MGKEMSEVNETLLKALVGLLDQLDGIGIPDWHGAEGLDLTEAREAVAKCLK